MRTKNLYVAEIRRVYEVEENGVNYTGIGGKNDDIIISVVKPLGKYYVNVLNGKKYLKFAELNYKSSRKLVGCYCINSMTPIESFLPNENEIDEFEIKELCRKIKDILENKMAEENSLIDNNIEEQKNVENSINDPLLKMILESKEEIQKKKISNELKTVLIQKLQDLGIYYIKRLKEYKKEERMLDFESYKYQIINECIKKTVEIEFLAYESEVTGFDTYQVEKEFENFIKVFKD